MSLDKLLEVKMNDEEIFALLEDSLRDITGWDEEITPQTLLIDDLGLDSLGFLDLFFTIQTSIQKEVTNDEMRNLILEELGLLGKKEIQEMSEGERDRVAYPQLKVQNFFNIIKRQIDPGLQGVDLDKHSDVVFDVSAIESFLQQNFEQMKEQKIEEQISQNKVEDPRMQKVIRDAFGSINSDKVKDIVIDRKLMANIVKNFLKDKLDLNSPEAMKQWVLGGEKKLNVNELLSSDSGKGRIFNQFLEGKKEQIFESYLDTDKDAVISEILQARKEEVLSQVMSEGKENLVLKIFERRQEEVLEHLHESEREKFKEQILNGEQSYADLLKEFAAQADMESIKGIFEEEKSRIYGEILEKEKGRIYSLEGLSEKEKSTILDRLAHGDREKILDDFVKENKDALKKVAEEEGMVSSQDELASQLLSDQEVQQKLIQELVDAQIGDVFDDEIRKQSDLIEDEELLELVKDTFFTQQFKEEKIKQVMAEGSVQGDVVEDFMRENFDRIAVEETRRILEDHELRNKLIQDYIKENYDPMEAMQLNSPEKMRELQEKITQKYIEDHIDEIIGRYMNDYMDEMLESMPTDEEIEVEGDLQDEFMKKFMKKMDQEEEEEQEVQEDQGLDAFIRRYGIKDPMMLAFLETNFDDTQELFAAFEKIQYDPVHLENFVRENFDLKTAIFLQFHLNNEEFNVALRAEFTDYFLTHHLENHMEDMMELAMKKQFDFLGVSEERNQAMVEKYRGLLNDYLEEKIKSMVEELSEDEIQQGFESFFRRVKYDPKDFLAILEKGFKSTEVRKILGFFLDYPDFQNELKVSFAEYFFSTHQDEVEKVSYSRWLKVLEGSDEFPELNSILDELQKEFLKGQFQEILKGKLKPKSDSDPLQVFVKDVRGALIRIYLDGVIQGHMHRPSFDEDLRDFIKTPETYLELREKEIFYLLENKSKFPEIPGLSAIPDHEDRGLSSVKAPVMEMLRNVPSMPMKESITVFCRSLQERIPGGTQTFESRERLELVVRAHAKEMQIREGFLLRHLILSYEQVAMNMNPFVEIFRERGRECFMAVLEKNFQKDERKALLVHSFHHSEVEKELFLGFLGHLVQSHRGKVSLVDPKQTKKELKNKAMQTIQKDFFTGELRRILEKENIVTLDLRGLANAEPKKYSQLRKALAYLEEEKIIEFERFFGKIEQTFHLSQDSLMGILEHTSTEVFSFVADTVKKIEKDILVFSQNWILSQYDFLVADRVMGHFDQDKLDSGIIQDIQDAYARENSFRMFYSSFKGEFYTGEGLDQDWEKENIKEFSLEYMKDLIKEKVAKVEGI